MRQTLMVLAGSAMLLAAVASTISGLQGVVEQTILMPDAKQLNWNSTELDLKRSNPVDAKAPANISVTRYGGAFNQFAAWALGSSSVDAERVGEAAAEVVVYENLDFIGNGNYSDGDGMQSTRSLADSLDVDDFTLLFKPHDNPYGQVTVELVQKTYNTVWIKYARNGATDQTKYYYFRVANTLIDGSMQELTYQWSASSATSSTVGIGVEFNLDGEVQGSGSWSEQVDQGTDGFQNTAASRVPGVTRLVTITAQGPGDQSITTSFTVDSGFHWDLNTTDDNTAEWWIDISKLEGKATYQSVIGFGKITVTRNADASLDHCPRQWHAGTEIGNPELTNDRSVAADVNYGP